MPFIGTPLDTRNTFQSLQGKRFNGDGSTTDFTLDVAPGSTLDIEVFVGNVRQDPNSAYTLSGTTLSFTGAPPSGTNNIYVVHQAKSVGTIDVPDSSVNSDKLTGNLVTPGTLDVNGQELILDADADTSITADTDDQIDVKIAGADDFKFTANNFNILSGSTLTVDSGATITNSGTANGFGKHNLLSSGTFSSSSNLTFNNSLITSTYNKYVVEFIDCKMQNDTYLSLYSSTDNGSSYQGSSGYQITGAIFEASQSSNALFTRNNNSSSDMTLIGNAQTVDNAHVFGLTVELFDPTSTNEEKGVLYRAFYVDTDGDLCAVYGGGVFKGAGTTAVNNIKFQPASGNIASGFYRLYGVT